MSLIKDALIQEIQERIVDTQRYTKDINTAKTATKKRYLIEKRQRNNAEILNLTVALERINNKADSENIEDTDDE